MILYRYCFRYHLLPIALEKFPSTFDLKNVENKKFFPHLYNKMVNLEAEPLSSLPPKSDYFYSSMNFDKRREFDKWYEVHKNDGFDLKEMLPLYCMADVKLLSAGLVNFRELWQEECGFEVLQRCCTLAGAVMMHYRMNLMTPRTLAITSELSYEKHDKKSLIAMKFLRWLEHLTEKQIRTADSEGGEKEIQYEMNPGEGVPSFGHYKVDGFVEGGWDGSSKDLALEVYG